MTIKQKRVNGVRKNNAESYKKNISHHWQLYLMALPAIIVLIVFYYIPMYGVQIAFKDFSATAGIWGSEWSGFDNFSRFFNGYNSTQLIFNTLSLGIWEIIIGFPIPIIFALLLNEINNKHFKKSIQMLTYAPHFVSTVVLVGILGIFFNIDNGLLNMLLKSLGIEQIPFMASTEWFRTMYVGSSVWQSMGWNSIIYIAALAGIDPTLHEAAIMDGATKFQKIIHINIPSLMPTVIILLIMRCGSVMSIGFEKALLMQNSLNLSVADVISTYVYRIGLVQADFSFGAAVGLFNSVVNCVLLILVNTISKKVGNESLW